MRVIRNTLAAILLVAFAGISVVGVMACFPTFGGRFTRIHDYGMAVVAAWRTHGLLWLWLGLLVSTVATLVMSLALARRRAMVEVEMEDGRVVILETAIRKYIRQALAGMSGVTGHQIRLKQTRKGLHIDIFAQVRTHEKLPEIENAMIAKVRSALSEDLGIKSVSDVHVYIRDFEIAAKPAPRPASPVVVPPVPGEEPVSEQSTLIRLKGLGTEVPSAEEPTVEEVVPREPALEAPPVEAPSDGSIPAASSKGWALFRRKRAAPTDEASSKADEASGVLPPDERSAESPVDLPAAAIDQPGTQGESKDSAPTA
jgi:uncharacterized alkaline shock family protein YloU